MQLKPTASTPGQRRRPAQQLPSGKALPGEAVRPHGVGHDEKAVRAAAMKEGGQLRNALVGGQCLRQKAGDARLEELLSLKDEQLPPRPPPLARGMGPRSAKTSAPYGSAASLARRQPAAMRASASVSSPWARSAPTEKVLVLMARAPGLQIGPVDGGDLLRMDAGWPVRTALRPGRAGRRTRCPWPRRTGADAPVCNALSP